MKLLPFSITLLLASFLTFTAGSVSLADDGQMFRRNVSKTPELETEHAAIKMLQTYVPAQSSSGELTPVEYYDALGQLTDTRDFAKPLIAHYNDGHVESIDEDGYGGFPGHGERDAFAAVSLDDGTTWKVTNLSKSADKSSFKVKLDGRKRVSYPGDVGRSFITSDGNKVLVVWVSRYAGGGNPNYAMTELERAAVATHLLNVTEIITDATVCTDDYTDEGPVDLDPTNDTPCLYLEDHFGVAGSQGSSDMADEDYELIGELPYAAVWVARGVLLPAVDDGDPNTADTSALVWFKAERLTSARRDANRPEAKCVAGAGCVVTWQEDPDGMRPGDGEGPGEGWSGAVAHHETDIWYSYIDWDDFDLVIDDTVDPSTYGSLYDGSGDLSAWFDINPTGSPQAAIPMSIPVRLTDNAMCTDDGSASDDPYCYMDFNEDNDGTADFCASTAQITTDTPEGPDQVLDLCITEDNRLLRGNTASTRARLGLHANAADDPDSAWFYMSYEENKGLGECDDEGTKTDMGKNVWYHTFDMFNPELVSQGMMLNQPAIYPDDFSVPADLPLVAEDLGTEYNFFQIDPDPIYEPAGLETTLMQTEISRRTSPISQNWYDAGVSKTVALQLWKQGIIRRGGPADIMGRRFVMQDVAECPSMWEFCQDVYEWCEVSFSWCENDCVAHEPNPKFKEDKLDHRLCQGDDKADFCYRYIDPEGNPTDAEETCGVEQCYEDSSCGATLPNTCTEEEVCSVVDDCDPGSDQCTLFEDGDCQVLPACPDGETCTEVPPPQDCTIGSDNPYDYTNMVCENWMFRTDMGMEANPRYVKGFCADTAINLSGSTVLTGENCSADACSDLFVFTEYFDDLEGGNPIPQIYTWEQRGPDYGETVADTTLTNLDDTTWENPFDVAKGHRGFMTGDMIMAMYAASPNWNMLTAAHDVFNLYVRRSFDGGQTWSTLPESFTHTDGVTYSGAGTETCEWMFVDGITETEVCTTYAAGEFEQARNVSQLTGSKVTVLDPRYAPTARSILTDGGNLYPDDVRDPSLFFMVYETGIASAYDAGEAEPLDLFYSRAFNWGDDYELVEYYNEQTQETTYGFDWLEGSQFAESGEASVTANPAGTFFYSIWNQVDFDTFHEEVGSDAWFRRVMYLDDVTTAQ